MGGAGDQHTLAIKVTQYKDFWQEESSNEGGGAKFAIPTIIHILAIASTMFCQLVPAQELSN